jgi:predicted lysophospholipase L1 biosynthesis ABC-type transport system permease subunit
VKVITAIVLGIMGAVIMALAAEARDRTVMINIFNWSSPSIELKTVTRAVGCLLILGAGIIGFSGRRKDIV